uniref:C2H2-type domain-containing protein n=1 Tax=Sinocyclocheilus rhinocerous TaxID=307959 RepID=A0A673MW66_9TELE
MNIIQLLCEILYKYICDPGPQNQCKVCPLTFFSKSDMQIHSKSHTEAKPHKCPHCTKSFANASYLSQHLRIHLGVKPYHCSYCEKSFRQLSHLQQHTSHKVKFFETEIYTSSKSCINKLSIDV